jgi:hypothetical protein
MSREARAAWCMLMDQICIGYASLLQEQTGEVSSPDISFSGALVKRINAPILFMCYSCTCSFSFAAATPVFLPLQQQWVCISLPSWAIPFLCCRCRGTDFAFHCPHQLPALWMLRCRNTLRLHVAYSYSQPTSRHLPLQAGLNFVYSIMRLMCF